MGGPAELVAPEVVSGRFVEHMSEDEYHAHPALSSTGMKELLRSPKYYRMRRSLHQAKSEFDEGHAVHALVLGVGAPIVEIPASILASNGAISTREAKAFVDEARQAGQVPLKPDTYARINRAAEAVLSNEKARTLLEKPGFTEVSLFATDPVTGVDLRCRFDRLTADLLPVDVKSTTDVTVRKIERSIIDFGYDVQAFAYRYVLSLVLGVPVEEIEPMTFIFAEKDLPHEVRVVRLADPVWAAGGEQKMRAAIDLFAWCAERGVWPGDDEDGGPVMDLPAPGWYRAQTTEVEVY